MFEVLQVLESRHPQWRAEAFDILEGNRRQDAGKGANLYWTGRPIARTVDYLGFASLRRSFPGRDVRCKKARICRYVITRNQYLNPFGISRARTTYRP